MHAFRRCVLVAGGVSLGLVLAGLLVLVTAAIRIAGYEQVDDARRLAKKAHALAAMSAATSLDAPRPNLVLILFDDLGRGDLGAYGSRAIATPRIDRLATEGVALDHFYAPAPVCTPSRAGLLTGRWPIRTGLPHVVFPTGAPIDRLLRALGLNVRLPADEITLAEALRAGGYATGMVGKWHLGDQAPSLPRDFGFDVFEGVLYSNDMSPFAFYRGEEIVVADPVDQSTLTERYTDAAVGFVEAHASVPFFLYLAHSFPHIPLHASPAHAGESEGGRYGDVVEDLDRSVGAVLDALERAGVADDTLVIVTSDNGPWFEGSAGALRGRKGDAYEGGMRVPFVARWPGRVPAGVRRDDVAVGLDVFPTLLAFAGVPLPDDRIIDGVDLGPWLLGGAALPERPIFYYEGSSLRAVREGGFKWHARHGIPYQRLGRLPLAAVFSQGPWLFDLARDPDESYDVHARHADVSARLEALADAHAREVAANPRGWLD